MDPAAQFVKSEEEDWSRLALAVKKHGPNALLHLLMPLLKQLFRNENECFKRLKEVKELEGLIHKCWKWKCPNKCPKKGQIILKDLDISGLNAIFRNLEIINANPKFQKMIENFRKSYVQHFNTICGIRNDVFHFEDITFDPTWKRIRTTLSIIKYPTISEFDELKHCSLDPNLLQKLYEIMKEIRDEFQGDVKQLKNQMNYLEVEITKLKSECSQETLVTLEDLEADIKVFKEDITTKMGILEEQLEAQTKEFSTHKNTVKKKMDQIGSKS